MFEILALISIGFMVGLSGAVIPGPLLAFTVFDTSKKRRVTGHLVIVGHALWEAVVIVIILLGFGGVVMQNKLVVYVVGGFVLILMGVAMLASRRREVGARSFRVNSSLLGGVFYTAFNPTQPPWWATAGLALLLRGIELMGVIGIILVTLGHWLSDFAYYIFVSFMVHRHEAYLNPRQREISILLGLFVALLGVYFITQAL
mgnify:CR=1 FL=1